MFYPDVHGEETGPRLLDVAAAARALRASGVLVYPTETFFAIGCLAGDAAGVAAVFRAKMRPPTRTLPLLAADAAQAAQVVDMRAMPAGLDVFWPGPLTVLLPACAGLPAALVNGQGKAAVRVTPHPLAAALARAAGGPLTSSSANISGHASVSEVRMLEPTLLARVSGVLDGCPRTAGGEPSTLVEPLGGKDLRLLRRGAVTEETLEQAGWRLC